MTAVLQRSYVWTSLILILAVLGAVLAVRSEGARKAPPGALGAAALLAPAAQARAAHDGQPAKARGVRRLVRRDRGWLRDGPAEPGRPRAWMGGGDGSAHRRVDPVRLDGAGGVALPGLAELRPGRSRPGLGHPHPPGHYLAEDYDVEAYYLRAEVPWQRWSNTYYFSYPGGTTGRGLLRAAIGRHYFSLVILDFGDTAAADRQITAALRRAGGYYVLAHAGRYTIWASREPTPARVSGGSLAVTETSAAERLPEIYLPATA